MNICADCLKSTGGCSWSGVDKKTNTPRFEPVPGWVAEPTTVGAGRAAQPSFDIKYCPEFVRDPRCSLPKRLRCRCCGELLDPRLKRTAFCAVCLPPGYDYPLRLTALRRALRNGATCTHRETATPTTTTEPND